MRKELDFNSNTVFEDDLNNHVDHRREIRNFITILLH